MLGVVGCLVRLSGRLADARCDRVETVTLKPTLDEVFLQLTGHSATSTTDLSTKQAS